jgi:hypothetical protein
VAHVGMEETPMRGIWIGVLGSLPIWAAVLMFVR